jgi:hypothetical protein
MLTVLFGCALFVMSALLWRMGVPTHLMRLGSDVQLRWTSWHLHTTRITIDPHLAEQVVPVNDHLQLIRHASGHLAFLPVARPLPVRRPLPPALRSLLLLFFSL